jgi:competence protein ComFC
MRWSFKFMASKSLDLLFPISCIGCSAADFLLCQNCKDSLKFLNQNEMQDGIISAFPYANPLVQKIIVEFKYNGIRNLAKPIAELINKSLRLNSDLDDTWILTYIPMHWRKEKKRGFNQAKLIAQELSKLTSLPCEDLLEKLKATKPQKDLSREQRQLNLFKVFRAYPETLNKKIILIDDVCTTGSTLLEAKRALLDAGAKEVLYSTFAREL